MKSDSYANVAILAIASAFAFACMPLLILTASLVGSELAPSKALATTPIATCIIGLASGIWPISRFTAKFGRKTSFFTFLWLGVGACLLASFGIGQKSFYLFCAGTFLFGFSNASAQQFRFGAVECLGKQRAATAASIILSGGIIAAFIGPELAVLGKDFTNNQYQGSFWLGAVSLSISSVLILMFKAAPMEESDNKQPARPIKEMINPGFCLAICSGAVSYFVMNLVMTATPISMHHHFMHSLDDTKFVIQSHVAAMYLPSLISPLFFRWFGTLNMMKIGLGIYAITIFIGQFLTDVMGFWLQLVLLGVGWNFLFVASTAMLSNSYQPQDRLKAQAINDFLMFSLQAVAAISAGIIMARVSWAALVSIGLAPIILMIVIMSWYCMSERRLQLK